MALLSTAVLQQALSTLLDLSEVGTAVTQDEKAAISLCKCSNSLNFFSNSVSLSTIRCNTNSRQSSETSNTNLRIDELHANRS